MFETEILRDHRVRRTTTALLTTYRRDGRAVSTIVSVLAHEGRFYFVSPVDSGKVKRLARCDRVEVTPCTRTGRPLGDPIPGRALPHPRDACPSRRFLLSPWRPLLPSWAQFRIRGHRMQFFAVLPSDSTGAP
jgi:PPOX class probable F420-dependent enzyme